LCQIHAEDVLGLSDEFQGQGEMSKVNVTRDNKLHFSALLVARVQFAFSKTSSASSLLLFLSNFTYFIDNTQSI